MKEVQVMAAGLAAIEAKDETEVGLTEGGYLVAVAARVVHRVEA